MPSYSTIVQSPTVRAIVQSGLLVREFKDALFPPLLWRGEGIPVDYPDHVGDQLVFTAKGLLAPSIKPLVPGVDPTPKTLTFEQWFAQIQQYGDAIDTHMPTDIVAAAKFFVENTKALGLQAGQSLNRGARDQIYNAAESGNTVTTAAATSTSVPVARLNGFTRARGVSGSSPVAFNPVSSTNPLPVVVYNGSTPSAVVNVVGYTPTNPGDEIGPGTLTLDTSVTYSLRGAVLAVDRSQVVNAAGGLTVDALGSGDILTPDLVRTAVARLRTQNVPTHAGSGYYHGHLDPTSEAQLFASTEFQRLNTSIPDYVLYKDLCLGTMQGVAWFRDNETPRPDNVVGGTTAAFSLDDPLGCEVWTTGAISGLPIHRPLIIGAGGLMEANQSQDELLTIAGLNGSKGEAQIVNNNVEVNTDGIRLIFRAPIDRMQTLVSAAWMWLGLWTFRTDALSGDAARYKRAISIQTTE